MKSNTKKYKEIFLPIIATHLPAAKIILYGSRARGDDKEGSDIDVAIDMGAEINESVFSKIHFDLEDSDLPISFDIIDFHKVSKELQNQIIKDGVIWKN